MRRVGSSGLRDMVSGLSTLWSDRLAPARTNLQGQVRICTRANNKLAQFHRHIQSCSLMIILTRDVGLGEVEHNLYKLQRHELRVGNRHEWVS